MEKSQIIIKINYFRQDMNYDYIKFINRMGGNYMNAYNPATGKFVAPKNGRYSFTIQMSVDNPAKTGYSYQISFRVNDENKYHLYASAALDKDNKDSRHFKVEFDLHQDDKVGFYLMSHTDAQFAGSSFIEGKMVKNKE